MASSLSFEEILCRVSENKRYLLDAKVENDRHLVEIARKIPDWQEVLPYLIETEVEVTEAAILEEHRKPERRRLAEPCMAGTICCGSSLTRHAHRIPGVACN